MIFRGISGLRVGWLHTLNQDLTGAMDSLAYFCMPSTIIQEAAAQMLLDKPFVAAYLQENQQRLARSYDALTGACAMNLTAMLAVLTVLRSLQSCSLSADSMASILWTLPRFSGRRPTSCEIGAANLRSVIYMRSKGADARSSLSRRAREGRHTLHPSCGCNLHVGGPARCSSQAHMGGEGPS